MRSIGLVLIPMLLSFSGGDENRAIQDWVRKSYLLMESYNGWTRVRRYANVLPRAVTHLLSWPEGSYREYMSAHGHRFVSVARDEPPGPFEYASAVQMAAEEAIKTIVACEPTLKRYEAEIFVNTVAENEQQTVVEFFVNRASSTTDPHRRFLASFVISRGSTCFVGPTAPQSVDAVTGRNDRQFWDIFELQGDQYVLIAEDFWESHGFEVYKVGDDGRLQLMTRFLYWNADE
jgi:hypothetical protein